MKILAHVHEMAADEIRRIVPETVIETIKRTDPDPLFRAYVVGHEGVSRGMAVDFGINVVKRWMKTAIKKLSDLMKPGIPVYHGHAADDTGRISIGEIVGRTIKNIKNKMSVVAVAYIKPEFRLMPLDVASIEADIVLTGDGGNDSVYDVDVQNVTGVALGNSAIERPGFANATLLTQLHAFVDEIKHDGARRFELAYSRNGQLRKFKLEGKP